jgi:CheY-like chemotaxis protein
MSEPAEETNRGTDAPSPRRVLVVEDDESTQLLFETLLSKQFQVDVEQDPEQGLARTEETSYDLVLLDIYLQHDELDGVAVLERLRNREGYAEVPIIAITAYALPGDRDRFIEAGFDEYVSKPFERTKLLAMIDELITR